MFSVFCVYIYVNKITTRREREAAGSEYKYNKQKKGEKHHDRYQKNQWSGT